MAIPNVYFKIIDYSAYISGVEGTVLGLVAPTCWGDESEVNFVSDLSSFYKRMGVFISPTETPAHLSLVDFYKFGKEVLLVRYGGSNSTCGYFYVDYKKDVVTNKIYWDTIGNVQSSNQLVSEDFNLNPYSFLFVRSKYRGSNPLNTGVIAIKFKNLSADPSLNGEVFCSEFKIEVDLLYSSDSNSEYVLGLTPEREEFLVSLDKNAKDGFGNSIFIEDVINSKSNLIYVKVNDSLSLQGIYLANGVDITLGYDSNNNPILENLTSVGYNKVKPIENLVYDISDLTNNPNSIAGKYEIFKNKNKISKLDILIPGYHDKSVYFKLDEVAQSRRDSFYLISPSYTEIVSQNGSSFAEKYVNFYKGDSSGENLPKSYYGAVYSTLIYTYEPYTNKTYLNTFEGYLAGIYTQISYNGEVWDAHAGIQNTRINAEVYEKCLWSEGEANYLYDTGYNFVNNAFNLGYYIEGQQTLYPVDSLLKDIPVVLLINKIYFDLTPSLLPFRYTPNNETTRSFVSNIVDSYLNVIKSRGGLMDKKVRCDSTNNPDTGDLRKLNISIGIKPINYIYDIYVNLYVTSAGMSLEII